MFCTLSVLKNDMSSSLQTFTAPSFDDKILEVVAVFGSIQMAVSRVINLQHHRIAQVAHTPTLQTLSIYRGLCLHPKWALAPYSRDPGILFLWCRLCPKWHPIPFWDQGPTVVHYILQFGTQPVSQANLTHHPQHCLGEASRQSCQLETYISLKQVSSIGSMDRRGGCLSKFSCVIIHHESWDWPLESLG